MLKSTGAVVVMTEDEVVRMIESAARRSAEETAKRMTAGNKIRPPHVNQTQAAEMVGVSATTISKMIKFGTLKLNDFGMIPIDQIDRALEAKAA